MFLAPVPDCGTSVLNKDFDRVPSCRLKIGLPSVTNVRVITDILLSRKSSTICKIVEKVELSQTHDPQ